MIKSSRIFNFGRISLPYEIVEERFYNFRKLTAIWKLGNKPHCFCFNIANDSLTDIGEKAVEARFARLVTDNIIASIQEFIN